MHTESWYVDGDAHRTDGPAYLHYHENGQIAYEEWSLDGVHHRLDGPAWQYVCEDGQIDESKWFIDGWPVEPFDPQNPASLLASVLRKFGKVPESVRVHLRKAIDEESLDRLIKNAEACLRL